MRGGRARRRRQRNRSRIARATVQPRNKIKLSVALERMMEPYVQDGLNLAQHRSLVGLCALAWNLEVMECHARHTRPTLRSAVENAAAAADRIGATSVIDELKKRKSLLFPDDRRLIVDTSLQPMEEEGKRYLTVASTEINDS